MRLFPDCRRRAPRRTLPLSFEPVQLPILDYAILIAYLAAVVAFGCWFVFRNRTLNKFVAIIADLTNLLPGERITPRLVQYLLEMSLRGCPLRGTWDEAGRTVRVLRRP